MAAADADLVAYNVEFIRRSIALMHQSCALNGLFNTQSDDDGAAAVVVCDEFIRAIYHWSIQSRVIWMELKLLFIGSENVLKILSDDVRNKTNYLPIQYKGSRKGDPGPKLEQISPTNYRVGEVGEKLVYDMFTAASRSGGDDLLGVQLRRAGKICFKELPVLGSTPDYLLFDQRFDFDRQHKAYLPQQHQQQQHRQVMYEEDDDDDSSSSDIEKEEEEEYIPYAVEVQGALGIGEVKSHEYDPHSSNRYTGDSAMLWIKDTRSKSQTEEFCPKKEIWSYPEKACGKWLNKKDFETVKAYMNQAMWYVKYDSRTKPLDPQGVRVNLFTGKTGRQLLSEMMAVEPYVPNNTNHVAAVLYLVNVTKHQHKFDSCIYCVANLPKTTVQSIRQSIARYYVGVLFPLNSMIEDIDDDGDG